MKKFVSVLTALLVLAVCLCPASALAAGTPAFRVSSAKAARSEEVAITVSIENNPGIVSAKLSVAFDEALTLKKVDFGKEIGSNALHSPKLTSPLTLNWFYGLKDFKKDVVFATLTFAANSAAKTGDYKISVSYNQKDVFNAKEDNVYFKTVDGVITVTGDSPVILTGKTLPAPTAANSEAAASSDNEEKEADEGEKSVTAPPAVTGAQPAGEDGAAAPAEEATGEDGAGDGAAPEVTTGTHEENGNYVGEEVLFDEDGNVIEEEPAAEADGESENKKSANPVLWICIAAAVLVIAAGVFICVKAGKNKKKSEPEE